MMQNSAPGNKRMNDPNKNEASTITAVIWLDKQNVLQRLHISFRTLQNWRSSGLLPYSKIKGKIYYKETDIEMMLLQNRNR